MQTTTIIVALLILVHAWCQQNDLCWEHDSDCPEKCPPDAKGTLNFNTAFLLNTKNNTQFVKNMQKAQGILQQHNESQIISIENFLIFHSSLNCMQYYMQSFIAIDFCCYSQQEKHTIISILQQFEHVPLHITWNNTWCNWDHNNKTVYIHADADQESQDRLFAFVRQIESAISKAGIVIWNPYVCKIYNNQTSRVQLFHSTMARVTMQYPLAQVLPLIKQQVGFFGTTFVDKFVFH